jgi:hypothetical protein
VSAITFSVVALIFAAAAWLGIELSSAAGARMYAGREPAPFSNRVRYALIGSAALLGALAASWHSAAVYAKIPDYFTLVPLGAVLIAAAAQSEWFLILGAVVPFVPFAAMAVFTKGRGFDWDDAKIAALGGALLGVETSIFVLAAACIVAVAVAVGRKRTRDPIVIAPYMIGAIGAAMAVRLMP